MYIQVITVENNQEFLLGKIMMPIMKLDDQFFRDELFELQDNKGNTVPGKLHLKLQWVHSRVKYLENVIKMWDRKIQVIKEDREYFDYTLRTLKQIFPKIVI